MKECRLDKTLHFCGCIPPFYASSKKTLEYCGIDELDCLVKHKENITDINTCNHCELSCTNTVFEVEKLDDM